MARCTICGKHNRVGRLVSHSGIRTSRLFKANLHKYQGRVFCTKCLRKYKKEQEARKSVPKETPVHQSA